MYRRICRLYVTISHKVPEHPQIWISTECSFIPALLVFKLGGRRQRRGLNTKTSSTLISISTRSSDILTVLHAGLKHNNLFFYWSKARLSVPYSYMNLPSLFSPTQNNELYTELLTIIQNKD